MSIYRQTSQFIYLACLLAAQLCLSSCQLELINDGSFQSDDLCSASDIADTGFFPQGTGTVGSPYYVCNGYHLALIGNLPDPNNYLTSNFILGTDIDLNNYYSPTNLEFAIGRGTVGAIDYGGSFTGIFNGNNHTISNFLYVDSDTADTVGLFSRIADTSISDLTLADCIIDVKNDSNHAGCLAGLSTDSSISNVHITGTSSVSGGNRVGGLIGYHTDTDLDPDIITDSSASLNPATGVVGVDNVGGLIGKTGFSVTILNSFTQGRVEGDESVGGLIGYLDADNNSVIATVSNSYSEATLIANINTANKVGGFIGRLEGQANVSDSYASGNITASNAATAANGIGGFIGYGICATADCNPYSVSNSYSSGEITAKGFEVGGFIGRSTDLNLESNYSSSNISLSGTINILTEIGGFIGLHISGNIDLCYAAGNITGAGNNVGGFVGNNHSIITTSFSLGTVSGQDVVGGFVGKGNIGSTINDSYSKSEVIGIDVAPDPSSIGGFAGYLVEASKVENAYAIGSVTNATLDGWIGGFAGYVEASTYVTSCFATGGVTGNTARADRIGRFAGESLATAAHQSNPTFLQGSPFDPGLGGTDNVYGTSNVTVEAHFFEIGDGPLPAGNPHIPMTTLGGNLWDSALIWVDPLGANYPTLQNNPEP